MVSFFVLIVFVLVDTVKQLVNTSRIVIIVFVLFSMFFVLMLFCVFSMFTKFIFGI